MNTAHAGKQRETENTVFKSRGHGDKRPQKEQTAILDLLTHSSIPEAAKAADISEATLWRWLQEEDFRQKLREAQSRIFDDALEFLGHASISTTQRYTHITKEHLVEVLRERHPSFGLRITNIA